MNEECDFFPKILSTYYKEGYLYAKIEYLFDGESFWDLILDDEIEIDYLSKSIEMIMEKLFKDFYIKRSTVISPNYWEDCYMNRTIRRMNVTLDIIKQEKFKMKNLENCILKGISVNGIYYQSVYKYIEYLKANKGYLREIQPHYTYRSHHDLISQNIIVKRGKKMISDFKAD